jgi:ribonuclease BN (tRNA processing enzyme)
MLAGTLGQSGRGVRLAPVVVDASAATAQQVLSDTGLEITGIGVPHADVPTIAYRIQVGDRSIVFGSDQNGSNSQFSTFAAGADVLVMHLGLTEQAPPRLAQAHARPAIVGKVARAAQAKRLVLSHFIKAPSTVKTPEWFSLFDLDQAVAEVRKHFAGPVDTTVDLQCIPVR